MAASDIRAWDITLALGPTLVERGVASRERLEELIDAARASDESFGTFLVREGLLEEQALLDLLAEHTSLQPCWPDKEDVERRVLTLVPRQLAVRHGIMPISATIDRLRMAMSNPFNFVAIEDIEFLTGRRVEPLVATERSVRDAIEHIYGDHDDANMRKLMQSVTDEAADVEEFELLADNDEVDLSELERASGEAPVIKLVNLIITDALRRNASDIHIEPFEDDVRVRFRVDGVLYEVMRPPKTLQLALISRIKIMSQLNISETRRPQDGRIKLRVHVSGEPREIDLRVSSAPMIWGEKIVMRLLVPEQLMLDMTKLGFDEHSLRVFKEAIANPYGIVLVTGPTGSGKTNTLYSALTSLNNEDTNILTAEDPVEFNLPGINQLQVRENIGVTFSAALRSFLRQDPNIILVGEVRDSETADIAVRAALTGHLVLSTLHTNDAPSSINRLAEMGVKRFLLSAALQLVAAQRLVRRLCLHCRQPEHVTRKRLLDVGFKPEQADPSRVYRAVGCQKCHGTGYKGRVGLFEVMAVTPDIREAILDEVPTSDLARVAREGGMLTLRESGVLQILDGVTTIDEVLRETTTWETAGGDRAANGDRAAESAGLGSTTDSPTFPAERTASLEPTGIREEPEGPAESVQDLESSRAEDHH